MSGQLSITEKLMYSTIRIECDLGNGKCSTGTGFLFNFLDDGDSHIPCLVTNKHVVRGAIKGSFRFTLKDDNGNPINDKHEIFNFNYFEDMWIMHPDEGTDLCIMPIAPIINNASERNIKLFYVALDNSLIPSIEELEELTAMEDVVMIGYPNGIWDSVNNSPIIRRGVTATHPKLNYEGREEFMIDAACFPGSSGSPVLLLNLGSYISREGNINMGSSRIKLLGVLYAGPQHTATGEIQIINVPTRQEPISISRIPNNLGIIIKSNKILDFNQILKSMI